MTEIKATENRILAHRGGLLTVCSVLKREDQRVFVKVHDEKRAKWVDLSSGKHKLFDTAELACEWIEAGGNDV